MKKMASILLIVFFALAVIGRLSSFFDRVQYQGISQDPSYRSLQVEQKLTPEQLEEYGVLLDEQQQEHACRHPCYGRGGRAGRSVRFRFGRAQTRRRTVRIRLRGFSFRRRPAAGNG